jgi:hypothetical protein
LAVLDYEQKREFSAFSQLNSFSILSIEPELDSRFGIRIQNTVRMRIQKPGSTTPVSFQTLPPIFNFKNSHRK